MKFSQYIKEEQSNSNELEVVVSFIEALKAAPSNNILNQFDTISENVKKTIETLNAELDKLDYDIQNISNSLAQEVLNQKEQERTKKTEDREKVSKIEKALEKIVPFLHRAFTNIDIQKKEFGIDQ